jgi:hypothetical protein
MTNAIKLLLQIQIGFVELESTLVILLYEFYKTLHCDTSVTVRLIKQV